MRTHTTPMGFLLAALAVAACEDPTLLKPTTEPSVALELQATQESSMQLQPVPFHMRTTSTAVWLEVYVVDDALNPGSPDADEDPDLVTVSPIELLGLVQAGLVVPSTFDGRCGTMSLAVMHYTGEGNATHLGQVTGRGSHCYYDPGHYGEGELVISAANGDELHCRNGNGWGEQIGQSLRSAFGDDVTFDGGTGRFQNATGQAVESGIFDFEAGRFELEAEGWIIY